jgi:ribosomal 50S subunit-recycling heat shock protein
LRLDKYLQVTRLVKKREFTRELCREGRLHLNGLHAKPARQIKEGDHLEIAFWRRKVTLRISGCPRGNIPRKEAHHYYEILKSEAVEEDPFGLEE